MDRIRCCLTILIIASIFFSCSNENEQKIFPTNKNNVVLKKVNFIEDGIYRLIEIAPTKDGLKPKSLSETIIATSLDFEHNLTDTNKYYLIDTSDYTPLKITEKPTISANSNPKIVGDTIRLSQLHITLSDKYSKKLETFTTKNVNNMITIVIGQKAITKHVIREPISGGKIQISRCTDNACEILLTELENNVE